MTRSYPGYPLRLGSAGEEVVAIQTMINRISQKLSRDSQN